MDPESFPALRNLSAAFVQRLVLVPACNRYGDLEIKCADAGEEARPVILDYCAKARAGAKEVTYQLIKLESQCAETAADCDAYKACVEKKKVETTPE